MQNKLRPLIDDQLQKLLGEIDEDVADVILEHMQAQKSAKDLVDDLEGVSSPSLTGVRRLATFRDRVLDSGWPEWRGALGRKDHADVQPLGGDEATTLVTVLYRQLLFEGLAKGAGLDTGSMTV